jgi:hypothetical protein
MDTATLVEKEVVSMMILFVLGGGVASWFGMSGFFFFLFPRCFSRITALSELIDSIILAPSKDHCSLLFMEASKTCSLPEYVVDGCSDSLFFQF